PTGEGLTGDPLREAEIVLDARARSRLSTERPAVEHDHRQAFGGGVHRGGESSRSRADDCDIVRAVGTIDAHHAEGASQLDFRGILEHRSARADDDWQVSVSRCVMLKEGRRLLIRGGINHPIRTGIPGEKALQANQVRMYSGADQNGTTRALLDQA